jgi:hypothetical protein
MGETGSKLSADDGKSVFGLQVGRTTLWARTSENEYSLKLVSSTYSADGQGTEITLSEMTASIPVDLADVPLYTEIKAWK